MAWVRIDDAALTHPKIIGLPDKAFRLWVWGLAYCQAHLTDGLIPAAAVATTLSRVAVQLVLANLWHALEAGGWQVHDYLDWNDSRELVQQRQGEARGRMAAARERRSQNVRTNALARTSTEVPLSLGSLRSLEKEKEAISQRAGRLREELYPSWYCKWRNGARLRLIANSLEFQDAITLCETWDDAHLEKLAQIILTTDEEWIARTDRGFKIFALKASWADDRLKQAQAS